MEILYLGYAIPSGDADILNGASVAGNKMQLNIIKEISKHEDVSLQCITIYPIAPYPHNALVMKKKIENIGNGQSTFCIGFINLPLIKQMNQILSTYSVAKKKAKEDTIILTYNAFPQVGIPALWLKRKYHCKLCCLLPDPPIDSPSEGFLKKCFNRLARRFIKICDSLIVLNKEAICQYAKQNTPYIIVEGGVDVSTISPPKVLKKEHTEKNLLYCGALTKYSGVLELISAMSLLENNDIYLDIYGSGPLEEKIKVGAAKTERIRFHGKVPNAEVIQRQHEAWLLVNPRCVEEPISQVTFPSKIFEYMTSGTPVLTTKLNGLTNDFLQHMFSIDDNSPQNLAKMITHISELTDKELQEKADGAYRFIVEDKNWKIQSERIKDFLMCDDK